jgi:hypothetical protein
MLILSKDFSTDLCHLGLIGHLSFEIWISNDPLSPGSVEPAPASTRNAEGRGSSGNPCAPNPMRDSIFHVGLPFVFHADPAAGTAPLVEIVRSGRAVVGKHEEISPSAFRHDPKSLLLHKIDAPAHNLFFFSHGKYPELPFLKFPIFRRGPARRAPKS